MASVIFKRRKVPGGGGPKLPDSPWGTEHGPPQLQLGRHRPVLHAHIRLLADAQRLNWFFDNASLLLGLLIAAFAALIQKLSRPAEPMFRGFRNPAGFRPRTYHAIAGRANRAPAINQPCCAAVAVAAAAVSFVAGIADTAGEAAAGAAADAVAYQIVCCSSCRSLSLSQVLIAYQFTFLQHALQLCTAAPCYRCCVMAAMTALILGHAVCCERQQRTTGR